MAITNSTFRISGLASGLDTDTMIKQLMSAERYPLNRVMQSKQITQWKMQDYRDITNLLRGLKNEYMDLLNQSSNMTSMTNYKVYKTTITDRATGNASNAVSVTASPDAIVSNHKIKVERLATAAKAESTSGISKEVQSTTAIENLEMDGKKLKLELDGVQKTIELDDYTTMSEMIDDINAKLESAFGLGLNGTSGKITASEVFEEVDGVSTGTGKLKFSVGNGASILTVHTTGDANNAAFDLNIELGSSNRINPNEKLINLKDKFANSLSFGGDSSDQLMFTINDRTFTIDQDETLNDLINKVNNDEDANVTIKYDKNTDKIVIQSKQYGAGENLRITQSQGTFFGSVINIDATNYSNGVDAKVELDGEIILRSSNSFKVNDITYNLNKVTTEVQDIKMEIDVDKIYDNIKKFIDKYNEVLTKINDELGEDYDRNYKPLTDEEKEVMSDKNIERWEEKAKAGLLKNDNILQRIASDLRTAVIDSVSGVSKVLANIGISTSSYKDKGKLSIDETKLKDAIRNDLDTVTNLFAKKSETYPNYSRTMTSSQLKQRYNEEGFVNKLYDIIENYSSSFRDADGKKGILLEKAGLVGDTTEINSILSKELIDYERKIIDWEKKLLKKEENYYKQFTALERAMQKANSQSSWLMSQLGAMQGGNY